MITTGTLAPTQPVGPVGMILYVAVIEDPLVLINTSVIVNAANSATDTPALP